MEKGIKNSEEVLKALMGMALVTTKHLLKDGAEVSDLKDIYEELSNSEEFKADFNAAREGIKEVPSEIKDVNLLEGIKLASIPASFIDDFVKLVLDHKNA